MGTAVTYESKVICKTCGGSLRYVSNSHCAACAKLASKQRVVITGPLRFLEASQYPVGRDQAAALKTRKFWPEAPCKHGHVTLRDTRTGNCYACRLKQRNRQQAPKAQRVSPSVLADRKARWAAEVDGVRKYKSPRACPKCREAEPERYVRGGACVYCASARSRRVYASTKKPPAPPVSGPALWESWFTEDD